MRLAFRLALLLQLLSLAACHAARTYDYRGGCGGNDKRPWQRTQSLPADPARLSVLAERNTTLPEVRKDHSVEALFVLKPEGEFMICRSVGPLDDSQEGEWWQFVRINDSWVITSHNTWVTIQ
jgi:hypothetical protein